MNQRLCEPYNEWMSLAQDGLLDSVQMRQLHQHLEQCPSCKLQWEAMNELSELFRAAPMIAPAPGFAARFQARLAYREERRHQAMIWVLLTVGVITLTFLALPSLVGVLCFTGRLILPYEIVVYVQSLLNWLGIAARTLADAAWVLVRNMATQPGSLACLGSSAVAGILALVWMRILIGRTTATASASLKQ
jgi:hypothetical protein